MFPVPLDRGAEGLRAAGPLRPHGDQLGRRAPAGQGLAGTVERPPPAAAAAAAGTRARSVVVVVE